VSESVRLPVSLMQESLWRLDQTGPGLRDKRVRAFRIRGVLDTGILGQALQSAVDSHPAFRTYFEYREQRRTTASSTLLQVVGPSASEALRLLEADPQTSAESRIDAAIAEEREHRFDLRHGPLFRAALMPLGKDDYCLICSAHRIAADRKSLDIVLSECAAYYERLLSGEPFRSTAPRLSYPEFAARQNGVLAEADRQMRYWKEKLDGPLPAIELPADRRRRGAGCDRVSSFEFCLPGEIARIGNEDLAAKDVCLGALQALLGRYTGAEEVLTGILIDRRPPQFTATVGPFENHVLLKTGIDGDCDFREFAKNAAKALAEASAAGDVPLEKVIAATQPDVAPGTTPFQIEFEWQQTPVTGFCLPGLEISRLHEELDGEVALRFAPSDGGFRVTIDYKSDLFDQETIVAFAGHYQALLRGATDSNQSLRVSDISFLPPSEEARVVREWNRTGRDYPRESMVHELFERRAAEHPEAQAISFESDSLTYGELNARANQVARALWSQGAGSGDLIGIALERSLEMVVALLGVWKAGAAYVPLDPAYPRERLAYMVEHSEMQVLITHRDLDAQLALRPPTVLRLDSDSSQIARHGRENLARNGATAENTAYVIYTSGSTGKPKGVPISHRAFLNLLLAMQAELEFTTHDTLLAVTTLSFDIAGLELHLPLISGGRVVLADKKHSKDGVRLGELIRSSGATLMQGTPATWQLLLDAGWQGGSGLKVVCGGEALSWTLATRLLETCGALWNGYGPTETTIYSVMWKVEPSEGPMLIGRPVANTQAYILDSRLRPVPQGVVGELYLGGDGLMSGYLKQPELSATVLLPNPFPGTPGTRIYKTGDLARYRRDGRIEFLGRSDQQVKIRGFRIEPGEVEAALMEDPSILAAVVTAWEDTTNRKHLVAYIERPAGSLAAGDLRKFLVDKVPAYMVPSFFVVVAKLPRTPNGKIDRRALPNPDRAAMTSQQDYIAPRTAAEKKLAAIWREMLGIEKIGIRDNYFDLGAESLVTARVFDRIRREFGKRIAPEALFASPTIEQLAQELETGEHTLRGSSLIAIHQGGTRPPLYCIHGGAGTILFFHNLSAHLRDRPIYGLQARGLYGDAPPLTTVREMAETYLAEIRRVQPQGPYRLLGYCFGGLIAFEMARLLQERGESVALLAFVNGTAPRYTFVDLEKVAMPEGALARTEAWLRQLARTVRTFLRRVRYRAILRLAEYYIRRKKPLPARLRDEYFLLLHFRAELDYHPGPYSDRAIVCRARGLYRDADLGWSGLIQGEIETHEIPGIYVDHRAIVEEPAVALLCDRLHHALEQTDAASVSV
jgi:amino acid adenylation domain-containing protein